MALQNRAEGQYQFAIASHSQRCMVNALSEVWNRGPWYRSISYLYGCVHASGRAKSCLSADSPRRRHSCLSGRLPPRSASSVGWWFWQFSC